MYCLLLICILLIINPVAKKKKKKIWIFRTVTKVKNLHYEYIHQMRTISNQRIWSTFSKT